MDVHFITYDISQLTQFHFYLSSYLAKETSRVNINTQMKPHFPYNLPLKLMSYSYCGPRSAIGSVASRASVSAPYYSSASHWSVYLSDSHFTTLLHCWLQWRGRYRCERHPISMNFKASALTSCISSQILSARKVLGILRKVYGLATTAVWRAQILSSFNSNISTKSAAYIPANRKRLARWLSVRIKKPS